MLLELQRRARFENRRGNIVKVKNGVNLLEKILDPRLFDGSPAIRRGSITGVGRCSSLGNAVPVTRDESGTELHPRTAIQLPGCRAFENLRKVPGGGGVLKLVTERDALHRAGCRTKDLKSPNVSSPGEDNGPGWMNVRVQWRLRTRRRTLTARKTFAKEGSDFRRSSGHSTASASNSDFRRVSENGV